MNDRPILASEHAILATAYHERGLAPPQAPRVVRELYSPSQCGFKRLFNGDFSLEFVPQLDRTWTFATTVVPVRPLTMGAEYFIVIRSDGAPIRIDLINGESIPTSSFRLAVARVDAVLRPEFGRSGRELPYVRLAELPSGISFLAATGPIESLTALPPRPIPIDSGIAFRRQLDDQQVLVDGLLFPTPPG
jgi:hypothetical protein